jgi:hypothetical protein
MAAPWTGTKPLAEEVAFGEANSGTKLGDVVDWFDYLNLFAAVSKLNSYKISGTSIK